MKKKVDREITKKDTRDIIEKIKEKLSQEPETACIFGDCTDCNDQIIYILPPN